MGSRPAFLDRKALARELMVGESTVDDFVRRGVLPRPLKLTSGCVRWRWESVDRALASLEGAGNDGPVSDEQAGVQRAIEAAKERGRGRAA
jgi:predicted DNA-binding transcriptional regulator AlpA